jgi:RNA polymerase sigma factor (sigma-70 family)
MRRLPGVLYYAGSIFGGPRVGESALQNVLQHLRQAVGACDGESDAALLDRFVRNRDASAFELIVWRHERMVRGVCGRLLHDSHDAEDAFQAAFLVLVRKAHSIGNRHALASWLYKVAYRCALHTRTATARRTRNQAAEVDIATVVAPEAAAEAQLGPLLDEELQALPEKYRAPLVLCYLEGMTYDQVARQLGCPKGTVSTRLTKARALLRARLARRGLGLPAALVASALCAQAASAAPLALVSSTVKAALLAQGSAASGLPAAVTTIAEGVLRSMLLTRMKTASVLLLLLSLLGIGVGVAGRAAPEDALPRLAEPAPAPNSERVYRQFFTRIDQEGKLFDQELLEPPFAPTSKFLIDGESHRQALAVLDDFLKGQPAKKMTPLQKAVLQRDLWAVLTTTAGSTRQEIRTNEITGQVIVDHSRFEDLGDADLPRPRERRALQQRLAQAMRRLALSPREFAALPDNLADAIKASAVPKEFDPKHPEQAFLPPDLAQPGGGWIAFASGTARDGLAAPMHTAFAKGRSVFSAYLRLPGGREATQAYLKKTADGKLSQFPEGTQTALLRRMLLIDQAGKLQPTTLTESVELRHYRKSARGDEALDVGTPAVILLSRKDLLANRNGGLRAIGPDETSLFSFQVRAGNIGYDALEAPKRPRAERLLQTCASCHARKDGKGGIYSVATLYSGDPNSPRGLVGVTEKDLAKTTIRWTRKTYSWGLLQGLWEPRRERE